MIYGWPTQTVSNLQKAGHLLVEDGNHGEYRPRQDEFVSTGVAFIRAADMSDGQVLFNNASHISDVAFKRIRKGIGAAQDILLSHKGTVGKLARVPKNSPAFVCSPQTTFWRVISEEVLDRDYLYYYMHSSEFTNQIRKYAGDTDMAPYLSLTNQRNLEIPLPPSPIQRAIAHILGTLDDKIELNRQMNQTLEEMARALFQSWFVDFDPVHAKARGEQPPGLDPAIADLFPDRFVETEIGPAPEGWRVDEVGNIVTSVGGATPSTQEPEFWDEGIYWFATPKDLSDLQSPILLETERKVTDAGINKISSGLLPIGTVLMSSRAPVGYLAITEVPVCINQGFIAMMCDGSVSNYYMLNWAHANMDVIKGNAGGTTFAEISKKNFRPIPALVPSSEILLQFDSFAQPVYATIAHNERESKTLAELRDTLLPRLISGELRILDVNDFIER